MTTEAIEIATEQMGIIKELLKDEYSEFAKVAGSIQRMLKTGNADVLAVASELLHKFSSEIEECDSMAHSLAVCSSKLVTIQ